jgi:hypothetical protein
VTVGGIDASRPAPPRLSKFFDSFEITQEKDTHTYKLENSNCFYPPEFTAINLPPLLSPEKKSKQKSIDWK